MHRLALFLLVIQSAALVLLIGRLFPGLWRRPPESPRPEGLTDTTVSVVVATLNEAARIGPCLAGLRAQGAPLLEVLIVDSRSTDGTRELVADAAAFDPRVRLLTDDPLPDSWVGKVWALEHGLRAAQGDWVLGIDADTEPVPGMVAGVVSAARDAGYTVASFSPRFAAQSAAEQLVQPALLLTLVYRGGAVGSKSDPERVLANGQCFLARRDVLLRHGGYQSARTSFADDVTLARHLARAGEPVGFLDGSRLYDVRSYASVGEMWREWGRSLDLKNATSPLRQWLDVSFLIAVQGLPLLVLIALAIASRISPLNDTWRAVAIVNGVLWTIRMLMLFPLAGSYRTRSLAYWCSWIADPAAALRILLSTVRRRRRWRGRDYVAVPEGASGL